MKVFFVLLITMFSGSLYAQNGLKFERTTAVQNFDESSFFSSFKKDIDGSVHLYKDWSNSAFVYTKDGKKIVLEKVNFNILENMFQSQITKDSMFSFRINNFDKLVLKNKVYKNVYANAKDKVYEVIYESDGLSIYKGHDVEIIAASNDPMAGRTRSKYSQKAKYYAKKSNDFISIRLSKKGLLNLIDKNKAKEVQKFVKENKLSFKKEKDIKRILDASLKN